MSSGVHVPHAAGEVTALLFLLNLCFLLRRFEVETWNIPLLGLCTAVQTVLLVGWYTSRCA